MASAVPISESLRSASTPAQGIHRDPHYYFPDGNAVFKVTNVLFRVHRSVISQDGSIFKDMFGLGDSATTSTSGVADPPEGSSEPVSNNPQSSERSAQDGITDDTPIEIPDLSLKDFRILLWALYALPVDLVPSATATHALEGNPFTSLARVCHKFGFSRMEKWALGILLSHANHRRALKQAPVNPSIYLSALHEIMKISVLSDYPSLTEPVAHMYKEVLQAGRAKDIAQIITISERLNLRDLKTAAYLAALGLDEDGVKLLTKKQRTRMIEGHFRLTREFDTICATPTTIPHDTDCTSTFPGWGRGPSCQQTWEQVWKASRPTDAYSLRRWDAVGLLKAVIGGMKTHRTQHNWNCSQAALTLTEERLKALEEALPGIFEDQV